LVLAALVMVAVLAAGVEGGRYSECSCMCCELRGETCERYDFSTTQCSSDQCSEDVCERKFIKCRAIGGTVSSACVAQESWVDKVVIVVVALMVAVLFVLAVLRYKVPIVKRWFPQPVRSERRGIHKELQKAMHRNQELISNLDWATPDKEPVL